MNRIKFQPGDLVFDLKTGQAATIIQVDYGVVTEPDPTVSMLSRSYYGREPAYWIGNETLTPTWRYGDELQKAVVCPEPGTPPETWPIVPAGPSREPT